MRHPGMHLARHRRLLLLAAAGCKSLQPKPMKGKMPTPPSSKRPEQSSRKTGMSPPCTT